MYINNSRERARAATIFRVCATTGAHRPPYRPIVNDDGQKFIHDFGPSLGPATLPIVWQHYMMRALVPNISRPLPNKLRPFFLFLSRPFLKATATTQRGGNVYFQPSSACKTEKKITMSHGKESRQYDFRCGPNGPSIFIYSCVYHENRFEAEKKKENGRGGGG